ncbi:MAG: site-2 protease family protein [Cytophagaceae bacterium]
MRKKTKTRLIQISLFLITLFTTTLAGAEWTLGKGFFMEGFRWPSWLGTEELKRGLVYSISFLGILTIHEFGHYITARIYKVKVSLPFYLPFFLGFTNSLGTFGAFIKIKSRLYSTKQIFDIGIAGPLAGFFAALILLWYGFTHLPPQEYIYTIHPEYAEFGENYADTVYTKGYIVGEFKESTGKELEEVVMYSLGSNLVFKFFEHFVVEDPALIPNHYEMMHYPILFAGYLALLFTAFNLLPVGQLDGGHILFGLFGSRRHYLISPIIFGVFVLFAGVGIFKNNPFGNIFDDMGSFAYFSVVYIFFLYMIFSRLQTSVANKVMIAVIIFSLQFLIEYLLPDLVISSGWLFFSFVVGRFLGVYHPPALIEKPLSLPRKILGWFSLIVFILCFTPRLFVIEVL